MRILVAGCTGSCMFLASALVLAALSALTPAASAASLARSAAPSPCVARGSMTASPGVLLLGEKTTVTLTFDAECPPEPPLPLHIVLVLDGREAMAGNPVAQLKGAAQSLVRQLDLPANPSIRVGVVSFGAAAKTLCSLRRDVAALLACIDGIDAAGTGGTAEGIREGLRVLLVGRREAADRVSINEAMVLISDGANDTGCPPVVEAARQAKSQGVIVLTMCATEACDDACLRQMASSARYFYSAGNVDGMVDLFKRIFRELPHPPRRKATVINTLPANMTYELGSAMPPAEVNAAGDQLTWVTDFIPRVGITLSLRVLPLQVGAHPVSLEATAKTMDALDRPVTYTFAVPQVAALQPFPITGTPSESDLPPPTFTPAPPATQRWRVYLPAANVPARTHFAATSRVLRASEDRAAQGGIEGCPPAAAPGTIAWYYLVAGEIAGPPAVDEQGTTYFGNSNGKLFAVGCDGLKRWVVDVNERFPGLGPELSFAEPPALDEDATLFVGTALADDANALLALDTDGGWRWALPWVFEDSVPFLSAVGPVVIGAGEQLYVRDGKPAGRRRFPGLPGSLTAVHRDGYILHGFPFVVRSSSSDPVMVAGERLLFVSDASGTPGPPTPRSARSPQQPVTPTVTRVPLETPRATATPRGPLPRLTATPTWTPRPAVARAMLPLTLRVWQPLQPTAFEDNDAVLFILQDGRLPGRHLPLGHIRVASLVATGSIAILESSFEPPRLFAVRLDSVTGVPLWEHHLAAALVGAPVLGGRDPATGRRELVYADAGGRVVSLGVAEDAVPSPALVFNWAVTLPEAVTAAPALGDDGLVYVGASGTIHALRRGNGEAAWESKVDAVFGPATGAITLGPSGLLHVATARGFLLAIHTGAGGLDPTAAWPARRHDRRNTGRAGQNDW